MMEHWQWFTLGILALALAFLARLYQLTLDHSCRHRWELFGNHFPVRLMDVDGEPCIGHKQPVRCSECGAIATFDVR